MASVLIWVHVQTNMEVIKEVTVWDVEYRQPNHVYLMSGERCIAYQKWGEGEPIYFNGKRKLDKRGRKFETVNVSPFDKSKVLVK